MQNILKQGRRQKTKTTELYNIASLNGTQIICCDLPQSRSVSSMTHSGACYIGMDPFQIETEAQERVHLAHELGHCETGAFYGAYSPLEIRQKHESRADRWAVSRLVPADELERVINSGTVEVWELAEYFNVTEEFMHKALKIHALKNSLHLSQQYDIIK